MCGIAGLFLPRNARVVTADLPAMLDVMVHRGPDGEKLYQSSDKRFQAGFKRLAIIDLETGGQPIIENHGARVLLGNGEIYNYVELKSTPQAREHPYASSGDMEVILPLHSAFGQDFVNHLNGMFGLALYEKNPHRLTLVRDRLGIKPLYWAQLPGGGVLFASEIKALLASGLLCPVIDEAAVSSYLAHGYVPAPKTLFNGINKLPPGCRLIVAEDGRTTLERYWRARPAADGPRDGPEVEEHLTDLLRDSLRMQLRSDVPLGALLSGGIDSGLMVAVAAGLIDKPLETYTVRFAGAPVDETPFAAMVSERYGTRHHELDLPAEGAGDHLVRLAWYTEEPLNDAALLPNFLIEQALGKHLRVALNGTGGDELFAGYGRYFRLAVERRFMKLPSLLRTLSMKLAPPMLSWQLARAERFETDRGQYIHDHSTYFPAPIRQLIENGQDIPAAMQSEAYRAYSGPSQTGALIADLETYLPEDLLLLLDRSAMASSVEGRVPFLDHRLVEAALAVPPEMRTPNNEQKGLERRIAERFLPSPLLTAPKWGFASPVPVWIRAGLGQQARRLLTSKESLDRGWWTARGVDRLLADPDRHGFRVYSLLMLELAVRLFCERPLEALAPTAVLEDLH